MSPTFRNLLCSKKTDEPVSCQFYDNLLGDNDFAPRLFDSVEEMNQQMITAWNNVVNEKDTVYHLGDVAMHPLYEKGFKDILEQLVQLTGKIVFIKGNHDSRTFLDI